MKSKKEFKKWIESYKTNFDFDSFGEKHYFVFDDNKRNGIWTVMVYHDGKYSIHGKGNDYCDNEETFLNEKELLQFLWENRKNINNAVKCKEESVTV